MTIGSVNASEQSVIEKSYSFNDILKTDDSRFTILYYRLKMTDKNGEFTYSNILAVKLNAETTLSILNNPVGKSINITHDKAGYSAEISISNTEGKTILKHRSPQYSQQEVIGVAAITPGIYILSFMNDGILSSIKFVKQ